MFKKIISILLILIMVLSLSACNKQDANSDITSGTSDITSTETKEENKETESTPETDNTESGTEGENPQNSTPTKPTESTTTTTNNKPTTTTKPSNTEPKDDTTTNKNDTPTTSTPTEKPTEKPTEEKPYYVGCELIRIDRPNTTYKVNGVPLLEKAYGTKYVLQVGDTAVFKIKMSDNGTKGFDVEYSGGCEAKIDGDLLKITATGGREKTDVYIRVDTKEGKKSIQINEFIINASGHDITTTSLSMMEIFEIYAMRKGLSCATEGHYAFGGFFTKIENEVHIKIPNNPDWIEEVFDSIDAWVNAGYKKFTLQVVIQSGYTGSGGY